MTVTAVVRILQLLKGTFMDMVSITIRPRDTYKGTARGMHYTLKVIFMDMVSITVRVQLKVW